MVFEFSFFFFFFSYIFLFFIFSRTNVSMNKSYIDLCLICHYYFPVFSKGMHSPVGCMSLMKACYQEEVMGVINITYILMIQSLITPHHLTADKISNFIFLTSNTIFEKSLSYLCNYFLFKKHLLKTWLKNELYANLHIISKSN